MSRPFHRTGLRFQEVPFVSGTFVRSTLRAVPAKVPDTFFNTPVRCMDNDTGRHLRPAVRGHVRTLRGTVPLSTPQT